MIKNKALNFIRGNKNLRYREEMYMMGAPSGVNLNYLRFEDCLEELRQEVGELLPPEDFKMVMLSVQGYTLAEIGEQMDMKASTVGVRIFRARNKLRGALS